MLLIDENDVHYTVHRQNQSGVCILSFLSFLMMNEPIKNLLGTAADELPYYAVIFTSILRNYEGDSKSTSYASTAAAMHALAQDQAGFLALESAREGLGITVSYWKDLDSIKAWKTNSEHLLAQQLGKTEFYAAYHVRIAKVERHYSFHQEQGI